jgi:hypothetical protein
MPDKELTPVQRYVLLNLMINAAALPYTKFSSLTRAQRLELVDRGYIVTTEKPITLDLTQKGHDRAVEELSADPPARSGTVGLTLYASLDFFRRLLEHTGRDAKDLFRLRLAAADEAVLAVATPVPADLEARIRKTYHQLAPAAGDYIMLAELRAELTDVPGRELDATLIQLNRAPDVSLVPESNQKVLTAEERAAAVSIGNQQKHLLAIGS